jgi:hypothetical protein
MKRTITYQICDVCGAREVSENLPYGWQTYKYYQLWKDGSHSGKSERSFIACQNCEDSRPLYKKLFDLLKANK